MQLGGEFWECGMRATRRQDEAIRRVLPWQRRWSSRKRFGAAIRACRGNQCHQDVEWRGVQAAAQCEERREGNHLTHGEGDASNARGSIASRVRKDEGRAAHTYAAAGQRDSRLGSARGCRRDGVMLRKGAESGGDAYSLKEVVSGNNKNGGADVLSSSMGSFPTRWRVEACGSEGGETGEWEGESAGGGVAVGDPLDGIGDGIVGAHGNESERETVEVVVTVVEVAVQDPGTPGEAGLGFSTVLRRIWASFTILMGVLFPSADVSSDRGEYGSAVFYCWSPSGEKGRQKLCLNAWEWAAWVASDSTPGKTPPRSRNKVLDGAGEIPMGIRDDTKHN
ncbi:hypothetical protein R3P38DRAFT_3362336 [Favolaschia claudopus]|uniref:Uncharacterized protein n=1 Tax=Favolaschia claudopus TaxID=2862362 RepID=A0AAW0ANB8_9AGAR